MEHNMAFETSTIVSLGVCGALAFVIPIAAIILYKIRHRGAWGLSALFGALTFVVFAMGLEQALHQVILPLVEDNTVLFVVYGALAAGIFEETGRLIATKTIMRGRQSTENAILMGLGHGGAEVIFLLGLTMFAYAGIAVYANNEGMNAVIEKLTNGDSALVESVTKQLDAIADYNVINILLSWYERMIAMIFHVCMSVWALKSVTHRLWLYFAAIAAHAALDVPAVLFQRGVITSIPIVYVTMTIYVAAIVLATVKLTKKLPDKVR